MLSLTILNPQLTKVFAKDALIQSPISSLLLLTAKKSDSCKNKSECVSAKLQMLPTQTC